MISQRLQDTISLINCTEPSMARRAALGTLVESLKTRAPHIACLQCSEADFFLCWQVPPDSSSGSDKEWVPVLGRCGKLMNLPSLPNGGLSVSNLPYCTAMPKPLKDKSS